MPAPACRARSAATPCARSASPTPRCSTARPARQAASRWPTVAEELPLLGARYRVGVLSNVDDDVFARTAVAPLVADADVLTSERLRAYKPHPEIYRRARERAGGDLVHVATSARDVRG